MPAPRAVWRGAISFGLVYVPVEMFAAARDNTMPLHLLDSRDFAPVGYQRINKRTGQEVDWGHIVKGYEYKKGEYVALSEADFRHANVKATETIEILHFTPAHEIPVQQFSMPYHLVPAKGGAKAYQLLGKALSEGDKAAIATFVMRGREHLCAIVPARPALILLTLRFADELLPAPASAGSSSSNVSSAELNMAKQLIASMTKTFSAGQYKDTYRADLMRRVKEKVRKHQTHVLAAEPQSSAPPRAKAEVIDLMAAMRNSLKLRVRKRA